MVNTEIRLIIFFAGEDGEALYSQVKKKKKDWELTVAQIMNSLLPNSIPKKGNAKECSNYLNSDLNSDLN